jgi:hypothetical protein
MKFAMRVERTQHSLRRNSGSSEWIILGFFFHDRGSHIQKSTEGMLQAVLHQLVSQVPTLLNFIYPIYSELVKTQRKSSPAWTFDSLCAAWVAVTEQRKVPLNVCIFLDALDEHDGDNNQLASFIYQLLSSADEKVVRIKICVASRTWNIFGEHFGTCPQFAIHEHTAGDIQAYTSERLSAPVMSLGEGTRLALLPNIERLSSQVTTKARGVFIWVRIVVDELVKGIRDGTALSLLEEKVSKMPEELGDLYRHTLERIEPDYVEEAYIMLQITLCSLSPLPIETFMKCVSFSRWKKIHDASEEEMIRQLTSRSGGLLEVIVTKSRPMKPTRRHGRIFDATDATMHLTKTLERPDTHRQRKNETDSTMDPHHIEEGESPESVDDDRNEDDVETTIEVQFIHQTVKDFVAENRNDLGLHLNVSTFKAESGYLYLLECGTRFGGTSWAGDLSSSMFEYAFLAEAEGLSDITRLSNIFTRMFEVEEVDQSTFKDWILRELPQYARSLETSDNYAPYLALAAAAGLKGLINYEFTHRFQAIRSPYILAMVTTGPRLSTTSASRESIVKLLLKFGVNINVGIPPIGPADMELLARISGREEPTRTSLAWVLRQGSQKHISKEEGLSLARLLLENGADPNTLAVPDPPCPEGASLLYSCILHYDVEAVKLLLLHEANASVIDPQLISNVTIMETVRGETTMSDLFGEYNVQTEWAPNTLSAPALLMLQYGYSIGIGSSQFGTVVGMAFRKIVYQSSRQLRIQAWKCTRLP